MVKIFKKKKNNVSLLDIKETHEPDKIEEVIGEVDPNFQVLDADKFIYAMYDRVTEKFSPIFEATNTKVAARMITNSEEKTAVDDQKEFILAEIGWVKDNRYFTHDIPIMLGSELDYRLERQIEINRINKFKEQQIKIDGERNESSSSK